jgi:hypothetical protein
MAMLKHLLFVFLAFALNCSGVSALEQLTVSFDLDETLISSANLTNKDLQKVKLLGYDIGTSNKEGVAYIVRPDAEKVLKHAKELGFKVIVITYGHRDYANDILESSGLIKYVDLVKSLEDIKKPYNIDYKTYPYHRNKTYPQHDFWQLCTGDLYKSLLVRSWQRLNGNKNIHAYIPSANINKYPPIYGSRLHIDNTLSHVDNPEDFVGIKVSNFFATELEPQDADGNYIWSKQVIEALDFLKAKGWVELYRKYYGKDPIIDEVLIQSYIKILENRSQDLLNEALVPVLA